MSHASSINRSTSLSDLADTECQDNVSVMMETLSIDQADMMEDDISQHNLTPADIDALSRGSYLGYFPRKTNGKRYCMYMLNKHNGCISSLLQYALVYIYKCNRMVFTCGHVCVSIAQVYPILNNGYEYFKLNSRICTVTIVTIVRY